jgi:hypothetical protein
LANIIIKKAHFIQFFKNNINLISDVEIAKKSTGIKRRCDVDKTVEIF